jgi:putative peptide zinc metalloprotease protein
MNPVRRLTLLLLTLLVALALAQPALAGDDDGDDGRSGDNSAVAVNKRDGASLFKLAFSIRRVAGDIVDNENLAYAYSECERCKTTAIAIQIVLVTGNPSTVTPKNVAVAVNYQCTLCETFATAYQFVVSTGGPVKFTRDGYRELWQIRRELRALRREDLSPAELDARVDALMDRVRVVLDTELVPIRDDDDDDDEGDDDEGDDDQGDDEGDDDERETVTEESPTATETDGETDTGATTETTPTESTATETGTTGTTTSG